MMRCQLRWCARGRHGASAWERDGDQLCARAERGTARMAMRDAAEARSNAVADHNSTMHLADRRDVGLRHALVNLWQPHVTLQQYVLDEIALAYHTAGSAGARRTPAPPPAGYWHRSACPEGDCRRS